MHRILVTGGTGFVGSHLVETLAARGESLRCLVRRPADLPAELVYGDLARNQGLDEALRGVDTVIHLAGATKALHRGDYYTGNAVATLHLLEAARGVERFVHVSSLAAAGPGDGRAPVTEDRAPRPVSHYGRSKLEAERLVRASPLAGRAVIVRPPVVYGPRDTDVFRILKSVRRGLLLEIAGGERRFSAIYVADLVQALLLAATHPRAAGRTYNIAHPEPLTWTAFGRAAAAILHRNLRVVRVPRAAAYAVGFAAEMWARLTRRPGIVSRDKIAEGCCSNWTCSTLRARDELGFVAPTGIHAGLAPTLAWYKEAGWLPD